MPLTKGEETESEEIPDLPPYDSCKCENVAGDNEFCLVHHPIL